MKRSSLITNMILSAVMLTSLPFSGCRSERSDESASCSPLADSLTACLRELRLAVIENRSDDFLKLLDPKETNRLINLARQRGLNSLRTYLESHFAGFPDPDTLKFCNLTEGSGYARLTLQGCGRQRGYKDERIHYTFALFRKTEGGWALCAISNLEKDRFGLYGAELGYLETELPSKLRFPRLF